MDWTDDRLQERFDSIDQRFDEVDRRFEQVDSVSTVSTATFTASGTK